MTTEVRMCFYFFRFICFVDVGLLVVVTDLDSKSESQFNEKNMEPVWLVDNFQDLFLQKQENIIFTITIWKYFSEILVFLISSQRTQILKSINSTKEPFWIFILPKELRPRLYFCPKPKMFSKIFHFLVLGAVRRPSLSSEGHPRANQSWQIF